MNYLTGFRWFPAVVLVAGNIADGMRGNWFRKYMGVHRFQFQGLLNNKAAQLAREHHSAIRRIAAVILFLFRRYRVMRHLHLLTAIGHFGLHSLSHPSKQGKESDKGN